MTTWHPCACENCCPAYAEAPFEEISGAGNIKYWDVNLGPRKCGYYVKAAGDVKFLDLIFALGTTDDTFELSFLESGGIYLNEILVGGVRTSGTITSAILGICPGASAGRWVVHCEAISDLGLQTSAFSVEWIERDPEEGLKLVQVIFPTSLEWCKVCAYSCVADDGLKCCKGAADTRCDTFMNLVNQGSFIYGAYFLAGTINEAGTPRGQRKGVSISYTAYGRPNYEYIVLGNCIEYQYDFEISVRSDGYVQFLIKNPCSGHHSQNILYQGGLQGYKVPETDIEYHVCVSTWTEKRTDSNGNKTLVSITSMSITDELGLRYGVVTEDLLISPVAGGMYIDAELGNIPVSRITTGIYSVASSGVNGGNQIRSFSIVLCPEACAWRGAEGKRCGQFGCMLPNAAKISGLKAVIEESDIDVSDIINSVIDLPIQYNWYYATECYAVGEIRPHIDVIKGIYRYWISIVVVVWLKIYDNHGDIVYKADVSILWSISKYDPATGVRISYVDGAVRWIDDNVEPYDECQSGEYRATQFEPIYKDEDGMYLEYDDLNVRYFIKQNDL